MAEKISTMTALIGALPAGTLLEVSIPNLGSASDADYLTYSIEASQLVAASTAAPVVTTAGTNHNLIAEDAGTYRRFTSGSAKTLTVEDDATEPLSDNSEYHGRNVGTGDLTIIEGASSVTINVPFGGTLVVPQGGTFTLKRVAVDEFDLFGVTVPA